MLKNIGKCSWTPHTQGAEENDSICLCPLFSLLQMKYILFVGENAASTDDIKMRQAIWTKNPTMMSWQELVLHSSLGKKGSVICRIYYDHDENFSPNPPTQWVKKLYPLLFSKYEIHKGLHLYRIHKKADIHRLTCR